MIEVKVPTVLRKHTEGTPSIQVKGGNIAEVIDEVDRQFAGFRAQVIADDGQLHRFINVYLNDEDVRYLQSLDTKVSDGDVVAILPAVAGG